MDVCVCGNTYAGALHVLISMCKSMEVQAQNSCLLLVCSLASAYVVQMRAIYLYLCTSVYMRMCVFAYVHVKVNIDLQVYICVLNNACGHVC